MDLRALHANYRPFDINRGAKKKPQPKQKDFWTDQISTGTGIGGALGGAATGAALGSIVPGLGTAIGGLIGGIAGGALGSGGGELAENFVTGEEDKFKNVGQEALLGGVFSAPPIRLASGLGKGIFQGGKAIIGKQGAGAAGQVAKQSLEEALTQPGMIGGALKNASAGLRAEGRGINVGTRLAGERIGTQKSSGLNAFLDNVVQSKGSSPVKQLQKVESFIAQRSEELSNAIRQGNRALTKSDKGQLMRSVQKEFSEVISPTERQRGIFNDIISRIQQTKDVAGLDDLRKAIDNNINFARNAASPEPAAEQIYKLFRTQITDDVANKIGAAKTLKSDLHNAFDAQELLLNKSGGKWDFGNAPNVMGISVPKVASRGVTQLATGGLGIGGDIAGKLGGTMTSLGIRQGVGGLATPSGSGQPASLEDALMGYSPESPENMMPTTNSMANPMSTTPNISNMDSSYQNQAQMSSPYSQENLMYDLQRDPANADKYIAYFQQLQEVFAPQAGADLSQSSRNALASADNAVNTVDQLQALYQNAGGAQGWGGNISNIMGDLGIDSGAKSYNSLANASVTQIAKALAGSGAGTVSDMDAKVIINALPTLQDTPEVAATKFAALRQRLEAARNNTLRYGGGTGGGLEDALLQAQGGF